MAEYIAEIEYGQYTIGVTSFVPGYDGRTWGPPEDCYPGSGPEIEYDLIDDETGEIVKDWVADGFDIEERIIEHFNNLADDYEGA